MIPKKLNFLSKLTCFKFATNKENIFQKLSSFQQNFDEKVKQKYIYNKVNDEKISQMDPEYIKEQIKKDYNELKDEIELNGQQKKKNNKKLN